MQIKDALQIYTRGERLSTDDFVQVFQRLLHNQASPAQAGALLAMLHPLSITSDELIGAVEILRGNIITYPAPAGAIDICGTGGDSLCVDGGDLHTFNISTAVAFVVAAAGVPVVKHGNRAASSKSGSADVLEKLGANLNLNHEQTMRCVAEVGIGFLFAPHYHPILKNVASIRQELGFKTIFNVLGPLLNPVLCPYQLIGVFDKRLLNPISMTLETTHKHLKRAWIITSDTGSGSMDELCAWGGNHVHELIDDGGLQTRPQTFSGMLAGGTVVQLRGGDATTNAAAMRELLAGGQISGAYQDTVAINAAAAFVICGKSPDMQAGITLAQDIINSGSALKTLENFVNCTQDQALSL